MAEVSVTIPKMLAELIRDGRLVGVEASSIGEAIDRLCEIHPELRVHIRDETGGVRRHVSCFHNGHTVRDLSKPLADGDELVILQAVSGG